MAEKVGSIYDLIAREHGVDGQPFYNRDATDADIADKIIARNNPGRLALIIINLGTAAVFVAPQGAASSTRGIQLGASGGSVSMNWRDDGALPSLEWHGQSGTDNQSLFIMEWTII